MSSRRLSTIARVLAFCAALAAVPAAAADQVYFSKNTNVTNILVNYINHENVRLDVSSWYLSEHFHFDRDRQPLSRGRAGADHRRPRLDVRSRSAHERRVLLACEPGRSDPAARQPRLVPGNQPLEDGALRRPERGRVRLRQTSRRPSSRRTRRQTSTTTPSWFTSDPDIVNAFKTKFDVMWNDTTVEPQSMIGGPPYLKDWNDACATEHTGNCADYATRYPSPAPMIINTARLEPDYPMPADMIWGQGPAFNNRLIQEINAEHSKIDIVIYRLEVNNLMQAILDKFNAGVPVRVIVDAKQYTNILWPEYLADARQHRQAVDGGRAHPPEQARRRHAPQDAHHLELRDQRLVELRTELAARSRLFSSRP